jgi:hypothetical protein
VYFYVIDSGIQYHMYSAEPPPDRHSSYHDGTEVRSVYTYLYCTSALLLTRIKTNICSSEAYWRSFGERQIVGYSKLTPRRYLNARCYNC